MADEKKPNAFQRFSTYLKSPGRQTAVQSAAPSQFISKGGNDDCTEQVAIIGDAPDGLFIYNENDKKPLGARIFDFLTDFAGSRIMFVFTCLIIIAWAIIGGILGAPDNWQIAMQDGSSIQCYISDTLLMRQQHNNTNRMLTIIAQLRSRCVTFSKLMRRCYDKNQYLSPEELNDIAQKMPEDPVGDATKLPTENLFDVCCNWASEAVGSLYSLGVFWGGIIAWIAVGPSLGWSDMWQLYVNTAVAVQLTFTSMFLQNTRRRHMDYLEKCLKCVRVSDTELEVLLRQTTGDNTPNPIVSITPHKVSRGVRFIDYYGDVIGTGIGAVISVCVFIAWFAIGDVLEWSDDWWLIIGTYTGLVGFVDGFVLRNVYFRQDSLLDEQFEELTQSDLSIYQYLNMAPPNKYHDRKITFSERISEWMGDMCATPLAVLFSVLVVIGLICFASAEGWNTTAQLVCNTPTMIIEGFLLIVLLQAHNMANTTRRMQMHDILLRRLKLLEYVRLATGSGSVYAINEKDIQESALDCVKKN